MYFIHVKYKQEVRIFETKRISESILRDKIYFKAIAVDCRRTVNINDIIKIDIV